MDHGKPDHRSTDSSINTARVVFLGAVVALIAIGVISLLIYG